MEIMHLFSPNIYQGKLKYNGKLEKSKRRLEQGMKE
jgi:hypothetical protein